MTLTPLPPAFAATVETLHRLAEDVIAEARKPTGRISLEATPGGFGTPVFELDGAVRQMRVDGTELVDRTGDEELRSPLDVDPASARALADWYELGAIVLGDLVDAATVADAATEVKLWPEHFDIAIELGDEAGGLRANYGFSPGDEQHPEPYAYVGPWTATVSGELWDATGFNGAELGYAELAGSADSRAAALEFFRARRNALATTARSAA